jgi:hypothetical protein
MVLCGDYAVWELIRFRLCGNITKGVPVLSYAEEAIDDISQLAR